MNEYSRDAVVAGVKIRQYLNDRGIEIKGNRAIAEWRGGERDSVGIDEAKEVWKDFKTGKGGSVIDLCMEVEGLDFKAAVNSLGERYHLLPMSATASAKKRERRGVDMRLTKTYVYQNADGSARYLVDRYEGEKDGKKIKTFKQHSPEGHNLDGIEKTIYHLPQVLEADEVFIVEGEKDADTLTALGLCATTNSGGAKNWLDSFNEHFTAKDVVILPDNDDAGDAHARLVADKLMGVAKSVKVVRLSQLPKGDVTDWIEREGGTLDALADRVESAKPMAKSSPEKTAARTANQEPLRNYTIGETFTDENGKRRERREPRLIDDICTDMAVRFLGFPRIIGSTLFDYAKDKENNCHKVIELNTPEDLQAWICGTSKHQCDFVSGSMFATMRQLMSRLLQTRKQYDVIASAPWFPQRDDAFEAFDPLPPPDPKHAKFDEFCAHFLPATEGDRLLMRAFFMSPMYFMPGNKPAFVIDTVDAQASGKTTVATACAWLYGDDPISVDLKVLDGDTTQTIKRILSPAGRAKRIALIDNVTTSLKSKALSELITEHTISGMRPYGRGEESRTNDLTWAITVNGASLDTDMASRTYCIHIKSPPPNKSAFWERDLKKFLEENRAQILSDILYMLDAASKMETPMCRKKSRFSEYDTVVLAAACANAEDFAVLDDTISQASSEANDDSDLAAQCVEAINNALMGYADSGAPMSTDMPFILRCSDVDQILRKTQGGCRNWTSKAVRRFVNGGHIKHILKGVDRIRSGKFRSEIGDVRVFVFSPSREIIEANPSRAQYVIFDCGIPKKVGDYDL